MKFKWMQIGDIISVFFGKTKVEKKASPDEVAKIVSALESGKVEETKELMKSTEEVPLLKEEVRDRLVHKELQDVEENVKKLSAHPNFEHVEDSFYVKRVPISIPKALITEFIVALEDEKYMSSLIRFWELCALNPDARCREDLFRFCKAHKIAVTEFGFLVTYRNVNVLEEAETTNSELKDFVGQQYTKTKIAKKSPKKLNVIRSGEVYSVRAIDKELLEEEVLEGNLFDLYNSTWEEVPTIYTDAYTGTMKIKLGEKVSISEDRVDGNPYQECSNGLHLGGTSFLSRNYSGSVGIVCLVNPMKVRAVPYQDAGKMRVSEYWPIMPVSWNNDGRVIPFTGVLDIELKALEDTIANLPKFKNIGVKEYTKHAYSPAAISDAELSTAGKTLQTTLKDMKKLIDARIRN